jgi:phage terminase Nu1 subunit (DNA packaging protein)
MGSSIDLGDEVPDKEAEEETEVTDEQEPAAEMQNEEEDA